MCHNHTACKAGEVSHMADQLQLADWLSARYNKTKKISASQKDEPGITLGMVKMFSDAGVKALHVGVNGESACSISVGHGRVTVPLASS